MHERTEEETEELLERMYGRLQLWRQLQEDFASLADDEELLLTLNGRQYVVRPANEKDIEFHKGWDKDGNYHPESE